MSIVITGHTRGLGREIYNYMTSLGHTVTGLSSSNGYHLPHKLEEVIEIAKNCEIFFNNVHAETIQAKLIERLYNQCSIVTSGSMGADYPGMTYRSEKLVVEQAHRRYKKIANKPMLLLKMGYLAVDDKFSDKAPIPTTEILNAIDCWLKNPRISMIEFENDSKIYGN